MSDQLAPSYPTTGKSIMCFRTILFYLPDMVVINPFTKAVPHMRHTPQKKDIAGRPEGVTLDRSLHTNSVAGRFRVSPANRF